MTDKNDDITLDTKLALISQDVHYLRDDVKDIKTSISQRYVSKEEHIYLTKRVSLLEKVVFGFVGLVVVAVVGALVNLVIVK